MASTEFVFLNSTGDHGLSSRAARQMRAHVTRTNFAKRRQRISGEKIASHPESRDTQEALVREVLCLAEIPAVSLPVVTRPQDPYRYAQILSRTWSQVFLGGQSYPGSPDEAAWVTLLASEPALIESTMAVGLRHWSPNASCQREAREHWSRAVDVIVERISSGHADTDAVIAAVATMAFGERLALDDVAWGIHIDGLARLLKQRREQTGSALPSWFYDLIILDALNNVLHFPRFYHENIVETAKEYGYHPAWDVVALCSDLAQYRDSLQMRKQLGLELDAETDKLYNALLRRARELQTYENTIIRATCFGVELVLHISQHYYGCELRPNLTDTAAGMKEALSKSTNRRCFYMDLTSFHLMIGAITAEEGSQTKAWFIDKLRRAVLAVEARGWERPLEVLEKGLVLDEDLASSLRALWHEISPGEG